MSVIEWLKKPKYELSEEEIQKKMEDAIIPEHARKKNALQPYVPHEPKPVPRPEKKPVIVIPTGKNIFFVENSYKMHPLFILNGYVRSGTIKRNMKSGFNSQTILIKGIQSAFKKTGALDQGQKGSLEIHTEIGLNIPDNSELEFTFKAPKRKRKKRKLKPKKIVPKPLVPATEASQEPSQAEEEAESLLGENTE